MIRLRRAEADDIPALTGIFHRAVHEGAASAYTAAERAAWAPAHPDPADWTARLSGQITVLAVRDGTPAGFMTLGTDGHLDLAYVLPEEMGRGTAAMLHDRLLAEATARGLTRLTTEASYLARRFFLRQGWREIAAQKVERQGVTLTNFRMDKRLAREP